MDLANQKNNSDFKILVTKSVMVIFGVAIFIFSLRSFGQNMAVNGAEPGPPPMPTVSSSSVPHPQAPAATPPPQAAPAQQNALPPVQQELPQPSQQSLNANTPQPQDAYNPNPAPAQESSHSPDAGAAQEPSHPASVFPMVFPTEEDIHVQPTAQTLNKQEEKPVTKLEKLTKGGKGFLTVNGEVILLRHMKAIEIHELIPIEKKYWVVILSSKKIPSKFANDLEDPRKAVNQLHDYVYLEMRPGRQEISYYQIFHPALKSPIINHEFTQSLFDINYNAFESELAGVIGMKDYNGDKGTRHIFKFNFRGDMKVVQLKSYLPNGEAPLGPQLVDKTLQSLPDTMNFRQPAATDPSHMAPPQNPAVPTNPADSNR